MTAPVIPAKAGIHKALDFRLCGKDGQQMAEWENKFRFPDPPGKSFGTLAGRFVPVGVPAGTNSRLPPFLQSAIMIPEDASTTCAGSGSL